MSVTHAQTSISVWLLLFSKSHDICTIGEKINNSVWRSRVVQAVVQAAASASALGEKHETSLFVHGGKGVKSCLTYSFDILSGQYKTYLRNWYY